MILHAKPLIILAALASLTCWTPVRAAPQSSEQPAEFASASGVRWTGHTFLDGKGTQQRYYLSPGSENAPVVVLIQGSGCVPLFAAVGERRRAATASQDLLVRTAGDHARVMVVEKPGVAFDGEIGPSPGRSEGCGWEFRARYELDDWVDVLRRALADASPRAGVALLGVSEGGTAAARLSLEGFSGSIGVVSGGACLAAGALIERAYERERIGHPGTGVEETLRLLEDIAAAPDAIDRYAWGQTFRRWSTFGAACNVRALEPYPGRVFIAYGTSDDGADIAAFEDFARLRKDAGRPVRLHPVRGGDHDLMAGDIDHRESTFAAFLAYAFPEA